jgi:hypothetical protein
MTIQATDEFNTTGVAIPVGAVFSYAGITSPSGWLLCQGQDVLRATYPQLFAVIGITYNTQVNPTGGLWTDPGVLSFRIPDYRGLFLKNVGTAWEPSGGGYPLDPVTLGLYQGTKTKANVAINGIGNHGHSLANPGVRFGGSYHPPEVPAGPASGSMYGYTQSSYSQTYCYPCIGMGDYAADRWWVNPGFSGTADHHHDIYGDNETRPINKGIQYIIKF